MPVDTEPNQAPIPPASFTTPAPQVVMPESEGPQVFTPMNQHLTANEIQPDGSSWAKIFLIIAILLFVLDAAIFGYNLWRGTPNPDLLAPINSLLNR